LGARFTCGFYDPCFARNIKSSRCIRALFKKLFLAQGWTIEGEVPNFRILSFFPIQALDQPLYLFIFFIALLFMNSTGATQDIATVNGKLRVDPPTVPKIYLSILYLFYYSKNLLILLILTINLASQIY